MEHRDFRSIVHDVLAATAVGQLLRTSSAIVLERIARGGATNWYYCLDGAHLGSVEAELSPGSAVSFYFDGRIRYERYSLKVKSEVERNIAETGDAVIGTLRADQLHMDTEIVVGPDGLTEFISALDPRSHVFFGAFPARDDDGTRAVTVILPDEDGVVRPHPH